MPNNPKSIICGQVTRDVASDGAQVTGRVLSGAAILAETGRVKVEHRRAATTSPANRQTHQRIPAATSYDVTLLLNRPRQGLRLRRPLSQATRNHCDLISTLFALDCLVEPKLPLEFGVLFAEAFRKKTF